MTEKEKTPQQPLADAERLYQKLKAGRIGTWELTIGQEGKTVVISHDFLELFGYDPSEVTTDWDLFNSRSVNPEDLPRLMQALAVCIQDPSQFLRIECRLWNKRDAEWRWVFLFGSLDTMEPGTETRLSGGVQDIQGRVDVQKARDQEHSINSTLIDSLPGSYLVTDASGKIVRWNSHFQDTFLAPGSNPVAFRSTDIFEAAEQDAVKASFQTTLDSGTSTIKAHARHNDGSRALYFCQERRFFIDGEPFVLALLFDVTDTETAQAFLAQQKQDLETTVEERTLLLRNIHARVDKILASTGQSPEKGHTLTDSESAAKLLPTSGNSETSSFADSLSVAFDVITEKMWWYKAIIDSIPFPLTVTDMDDRWTYLNAPALETVGAESLQEVLGRPSEAWGVDQPFFTGEAQQHEHDSGTTFSRYHPKLDRFFQGQISHLYDQDGHHIGHIEAVQDVTKIHEADERTRIMLDAMPMACNFWNAKFQNIDCNLAAAKLFHLANKQEYLDRFFELSPLVQPGDRPSPDLAMKYITEAFTKGFSQFEWMHQRLDGTPVPAEITLVRVEYGKEFIVVGYTRDLTELKRKEAEVDKERQLLLKIMESSPVCFVILVEGVIRFATPHATEFFGVKIGDNASDFYVDDVERTEFFTELQRTGAINWRVVTVQAADGSPREMLSNAFLAEYYGESCVMSWFLDVTEMRETERQLRLARDAAEESTRAKGDFLANMSHEIRTPMNAILGMTRLVLDTSLTEQQQGYLEKAEQSARALLRILNDILDFSKIEAGKLEMEEIDFHIEEVMQGVVDIFCETTDNRGLVLSLTVEESIPPHLRGDPLRLHQILINLVGNAIKFTSEGGVYIHVALLQSTPDAAMLRFSVRDTGIGLAPEQLEKLFSAFTQADSSTTRRYGGTGLGLVISKRLVEMMHGKIGCSSKQGEGAEFFFTARFPLATANFAEPSPRLQGAHNGVQHACASGIAPELQVAHLKGRRILVAEDNEINQIVAREILEKAGLVIDMASNGREALAMALANPYDLVFMDIQMPEMDGLTAAAELRRHPHLAKLPIVAMTAHAMVGDKEKSLAVGMNDHITKPIDTNEVFKVIARWVKEPLHSSSAVEPASAAAPIHVSASPAQEQIVTDLPSALPGIDVATGLTRVAGNKKLYIKLLRQVAGDAASTQEKITAAIMSGDTTTVREIAHSLKGAAGNLAITDVASAAEHLELAAKADDFSTLFTHLDALEQALQQYVTVVATLEGL